VALAPDGVESIVREGTLSSALPDVSPVPVELVSVGDHLLMVAEALARPASTAARDLRLFVLHRTLAAMPSRSATGRFLGPLAEAISSAIGNHVATERPDAFVAMVRGCGRFLVEAGGMNDRLALTRRRDAIATSLVMVGLGAPAGGFEPRAIQSTSVTASPARTTPVTVRPTQSDERPSAPQLTPAPNAIVDIDSLAPDAPDDVVDIASLAPDDTSDIVPIASLAPDPVPVIPMVAPGQPSRLESAFIKRRALSLMSDEHAPSLSGLIAAEIVPVTSLLYRGHAALSRLAEIRLEIHAMLADPAVSVDRLRPYLYELLDLVPLARDAA
jgi:hypothetical protein